MIFHIATEEQWLNAKRLGEYTHASLEKEGFIHCSTREQIVNTANRYFMDYPHIFVLHIQEDKLKAKVTYEPSTGGELFPHIYGTINLDSIVNVTQEGRDDNGIFYLTNTL